MSTSPQVKVELGSSLEIKPLAARVGGLPTAVQSAAPTLESPGFGVAAGLGAAFELKYLITPDIATRIEHWAASHLQPDAHGDRGRYTVTSVYCDTPHLDVFHRSPGYRRAKFRLRRYDNATDTFLERKRKRGTQVVKRRTLIHADELPLLAGDDQPPMWAGDWFLERVRQRGLRPTSCVSYRRSAFFGLADDHPIRLTLDRNLIGAAVSEWRIPHLSDGVALLPDGVLLEMKFHLHMPPLFRDLLNLLPAQTAKVSKYRRSVSACLMGE